MTCQEAEVHRVQEGDKVVELVQLENMFRPDVSFSLALWPIPLSMFAGALDCLEMPIWHSALTSHLATRSPDHDEYDPAAD